MTQFLALISVVLLLVLLMRHQRRGRLRRKRRDNPFHKVIFLDFDGVLHSGFSETFEHKRAFENLLKDHPDTSVVISSDWRLGRSLEELKSLFSPGVREQIVGATPNLFPLNRQAEVDALCKEKGVVHYMILDDTEHLFDRDCPNLLITNRKAGLTDGHLGFIRQWLSSAR